MTHRSALVADLWVISIHITKTELILKKNLIAISALIAMAAYAGDNVPGNCGNGRGKGHACLPGANTVTNNDHMTTRVTNKVANKPSSRSKSAGASSSSTSNLGNATNSGNNTSLTQTYDQAVSTAFAPALTTSNGTCMGSSSGGMMFPHFGISGGSTWSDENCDRRYDANVLMTLGKAEAALALMCQKASVSDAMGAVGQACPKAVKAAVESPQYTDPYVRRRLGLAN